MPDVTITLTDDEALALVPPGDDRSVDAVLVELVQHSIVRPAVERYRETRRVALVTLAESLPPGDLAEVIALVKARAEQRGT